MKLPPPFTLARAAALFAVVSSATLTIGISPLSAQPGDPGAVNEAVDGVSEQMDDAEAGLDLDQIDGMDTLDPNALATPPPCSSAEDDGSIGLANDTLVGAQGGDFCSSIIGDGPYGDADTDFYSLGFVEAGFVILVDVIAFEAPVETVIGVYDADGNLVASAEDSGNPESVEADFLRFIVETPGEYFAAISGCCELQGDPNDPTSGVASDQAGPYDVFLDVAPPPPPPCESAEDDGSIPLANEVTGFDDGTVFIGECSGVVGDGPQAEANGDVDFFRTRPLEAGRILFVDFVDFFGESSGAGDLTIAIYNESGELLATGQDDPALFAPDMDVFAIVVPEDGVYYVAVGGAAPDNPFDETSGTNTDIVSDYPVMFIGDADEGFLSGGAMTVSERPSVEMTQSIDPGILEAKKIIIALLDGLSEPAGDVDSSNSFIRELFNEILAIIDPGGSLPTLAGDDGFYGTADDTDPDFVEDILTAPKEGTVSTTPPD